MILNGKEIPIKFFDHIYDKINMVPTTIQERGQYPYIYMWYRSDFNVCEPLCALAIYTGVLTQDQLEEKLRGIKYQTIDNVVSILSKYLNLSTTYMRTFCYAYRGFDQATIIEDKLKCDDFSPEQLIMGFNDAIAFRVFYG